MIIILIINTKVIIISYSCNFYYVIISFAFLNSWFSGGSFCVVLCICALFVFVLCLVCQTLPVSLGCPFLISPSVSSNVYFNTITRLVCIIKKNNWWVLVIKLWYHFDNFTVAIMIWLITVEYLYHRWARIHSVCHSQSPYFPLSWLFTGLLTWVTQPEVCMEQEEDHLTLVEHTSSPSFCRFCVA
jgi:hypothetical protein